MSRSMSCVQRGRPQLDTAIPPMSAYGTRSLCNVSTVSFRTGAKLSWSWPWIVSALPFSARRSSGTPTSRCWSMGQSAAIRRPCSPHAPPRNAALPYASGGAELGAGLVHPDHHHAHIVAPAVPVRRRDPRLRDLLHAVGAERLEDLGVLQHLGQPVGAKQVAIAGSRLVDREVDLDVIEDAHRAAQLARRLPLDADRAERVIGRQLAKHAVANAIAAAVADVSDVNALAARRKARG